MCKRHKRDVTGMLPFKKVHLCTLFSPKRYILDLVPKVNIFVPKWYILKGCHSIDSFCTFFSESVKECLIKKLNKITSEMRLCKYNFISGTSGRYDLEAETVHRNLYHLTAQFWQCILRDVFFLSALIVVFACPERKCAV